MSVSAEPVILRRRQATQVSRIWLFALLVVAAITAVGCLVVQHKLANLRDRVREYTASRTAGQLGFDAVNVSGIRGIRLDGVTAHHRTANGIEATVEAPSVYVDVDLVDLFRGRVTIDRVLVEEAAIRLIREPGGRWAGEGGAGVSGSSLLRLIEPHGFHVVGRNCRVDLENVVGDAGLSLAVTELDLMKVPGSPETVLNWKAAWVDRPGTATSGRVVFAGLDDFDGRIDCTGLDAADVAPYLPEEKRWLISGKASASLRVDAVPGSPVSAWATATFEDMALRNQPAFLVPFTGTLTGAAQYDPDGRVFRITSAKAQSTDFVGEVDGTISIAESPPVLALRLQATQLPLAALLDAGLEGRLDEYGEVTIETREPSAVTVDISGPAASPVFGLHAQLAGADVTYVPKDKRWPGGDVSLGLIEVNWDSETKTPSGQGRVVRGTVKHKETGLEVTRLSGDVALNGKDISCESVSGEITGQAFLGGATYNLDSKKGTFELSGGLNQMENTLLADRIKDTRLAGSAMVKCTGTLAPNDIRATARVEAGPARIAYNWFFDKPAGVGASGDITVRFRPQKSIELTADAEIASSQVKATVNFERRDQKWRLIRSEASSDSVDVNGVTRCLRLPYTITGGTVTGATYTWERVSAAGVDTKIAVDGHVDVLTLLPEGGDTPFVLHDTTFDLTSTKGDTNTGDMRLSVAEGSTPGIGGGSTWFVDPRKDDPLLEEFPKVQRAWAIEISADNLSVPPWKGTGFRGKAYVDGKQSGLQSFSADIDGGRLEGWYSHVGGENLARTYAKWDNIPSHFLLEHLELPSILNGRNTGDVEFSVDRDDPDTKQGKGSFTITDGQFSSDYMVTLLEGRFKNSMDVLPPSLRFDELTSEFTFERDVVRTPKLELHSKGMQIAGTGQFVTGGDLDYKLDVALSPDMAAEIKPLRDGLNLDGLKLAQQNVELTFEIKGPMFNPTGQVSKLPGANVMIVGGALGLGSELIDLPRQILVDLLKMGGGLVGATK